jgi:hypothetical protein
MAMRMLLSFLVLAMFSIVAQAQHVERIEITEAGVYNAETTSLSATPGSSTGGVAKVANIKLIRNTTTIPSTLGTHFGFRYKIIGQPAGASINLRMINYYPQPGLRNPAISYSVMRSEYVVHEELGAESYRDYGLDEAWQLKPGTWTFEIWEGDRKLAEQTFTVVKP